MMINHILSTLKILTHLCFMKEKIKIKNGMQFLNSSLDKFVQSLPDEDFKYLVKGFGFDKLKIF